MALRPTIDTSTMPLKTGPSYRKRPSGTLAARERIWGKRTWDLKTAGGTPVWSVQDCTPIIHAHEPGDPMPFMSLGGWSEEIVAFLKLTGERRLARCNYSSYWSAPLIGVDPAVTSSWSVPCGLRLDRSMPAMTAVGTDRDKQPRVEFSIRVRWDGAAIVDRPDRYEVSVHFIPFGYDAARAQADITPRRLQRFRVLKGATYDWKLIEPGVTDSKLAQGGRVTAAADGLLTIERVTLYRARPLRLIVTPAK